MKVWCNYTNPLLGPRKLWEGESVPKLVLACRRERKWGIWLSSATLYDFILGDFIGEQDREGEMGEWSHYLLFPWVYWFHFFLGGDQKKWCGRKGGWSLGNNEIALSLLKLNHFLSLSLWHSESFYMPLTWTQGKHFSQREEALQRNLANQCVTQAKPLWEEGRDVMSF